MLDQNSVVPLYHQLKEIITENIKGRYWKEGFKVPSERELMETYKVSRATVRQALNELMAEGLIYRKQGVGTFVSESKINQNLIGELSFNQQVLRKGMTPSSTVIYASAEKSLSERIVKTLQLEPSDTVYKIIRVRFVDKTPLILETLHIPEVYAPSLLEQELESIAVFQYLEQDCKLNFTHSTLDIEPVLINEFESKSLEIETGKPSLSLERIIYSGERAIVIQKRVMRGDRGKFTLTLGENSNHTSDYLVGLEFDK